MQKTTAIMGMPITICIVDAGVDTIFRKVLSYFHHVDRVFSTYKKDSEISKINRGEISEGEYSDEARHIFSMAEQTKKDTKGYFDIRRNGYIDPSGIVKGYAIQKAAEVIERAGFTNFFVDAGGDIQVSGKNDRKKPWTVGIRNPFNRDEIVKILRLNNSAIATSGTAIRGQHIYNPHNASQITSEVVSMSVVGKNIYDADRFATAAFAMGEKGIQFLESLPDHEGYMIDQQGMATMTSGFEKYVV